VALAAYIRERSQFDRLIFNTSNHLIDGLMVAGIIVITGRAFTEWSMPVQIVITFLGISLVYLSSTALIAGAISISSQQPIKEIWGERFRWLFPYYLALGVAAYALSFSYFTAGLLGIVVVLIPLVLLRYSQKQYVDHTEAVMTKLRNINVKLTRQAEEITLLNEELLIALAKATDMRDPYVMEHSQNVARYAELIAKELGLPAERTDLVRKAGLLHDIGKLAIPDAILFKPEKLTNEEYVRIKDHVVTGADLIYGCHSLHPLVPIIKHHHECYDGSGYPDGLAGELIPLEARILGVSDAMEAMASDRPYRKGRTPQGIIEELKKWSGKQFDPMVVDAFIRVVQKQGESVIVNSARNVQAREDQNDSIMTEAIHSNRQAEDYSVFRPVLAS
jgi:putative nucleotidyltransferase with HDIG domain